MVSPPLTVRCDQQVVTCGGDRRSRERRMVQNQATRAIMGRKERERERGERGNGELRERERAGE